MMVSTDVRWRSVGRFGLSRSQVDRVLQAGRDAGLFAPDGAGSVVPTPALEDSFHRWIALELAFYAEHMRPPDCPAPG